MWISMCWVISGLAFEALANPDPTPAEGRRRLEQVLAGAKVTSGFSAEVRQITKFQNTTRTVEFELRFLAPDRLHIRVPAKLDVFARGNTIHHLDHGRRVYKVITTDRSAAAVALAPWEPMLTDVLFRNGSKNTALRVTQVRAWEKAGETYWHVGTAAQGNAATSYVIRLEDHAYYGGIQSTLDDRGRRRTVKVFYDRLSVAPPAKKWFSPRVPAAYRLEGRQELHGRALGALGLENVMTGARTVLAEAPGLVFLWATWCTGCKPLLQRLEALHAEAKTFCPIYIISDEPREHLVAHVERLRSPFSFYRVVELPFEVPLVPTLMQIDGQRRVQNTLDGTPGDKPLRELWRRLHRGESGT